LSDLKVKDGLNTGTFPSSGIETFGASPEGTFPSRGIETFGA
jgi:hypothetical protein